MSLHTSPSRAFLDGFSIFAALIVSLGAQNVFVLRQGLRREHVGPVVLFCAAADLTLVSAGVAGLGGVLAGLPRLSGALTLGGSMFLSWYGCGALRRVVCPGRLVTEPDSEPSSVGSTLARAAGFTFLNPHVYIDTVLLMGSIGATHPSDARPAFVLGAALASIVWFVALGFGARLVAPIFFRPGAWRVLDGMVAATMLTLALGLLLRCLTR